MGKITDMIDAPKKRIADLEKLVKHQDRTIKHLRTARVTAPRCKPSKPGKKSFVRVVFGDVHGEHMDRGAVAAFLNDVESLQPTEIVCIGDLIDCGGFLSQHKVLGVVAELESTYEQDVDAGNMVLDELRRRCPKASLTLIEGNHENRVNRWICDKVIGSAVNAEYLRTLVGPRTLLHLDKRGVRYIERHKYYDGLSVSGTINLAPHAIAQHGEAFCGKYAAFRNLDRLGHSVFFGHNHRLGIVYGENIDGGIVAVNTGCLCQIRPMYGLTKTTDWQQGYVAEYCEPGKGFLAIPVPIINGTSYLSPLLRVVGR